MIRPQDVRAHLERVSASPVFAESDRLRRFMLFTVECKLEGQHERVKEYILGREVFDRRDGYDPRLDPIVRVEARRLRAKLAEYYSGAGRADPIRLEYPKGSYLPEFQRAGPRRMSSIVPRTFWYAAAVAVVLLGLAALAYGVSARSANQMVAVLPAQWLWPNDAGVDKSGIDVAQALTAELANRGLGKVVAWPLIVPQQTERKSVRDFASGLHASKLAVVSVRPLGRLKLITVFLMDPVSGQKLRAVQVYWADLTSPGSQQAAAANIARQLAAAHLP